MSEDTVYFVIGAEYKDTDFQNLVPGTSAVHGPYNKAAGCGNLLAGHIPRTESGQDVLTTEYAGN